MAGVSLGTSGILATSRSPKENVNERFGLIRLQALDKQPLFFSTAVLERQLRGCFDCINGCEGG